MVYDHDIEKSLLKVSGAAEQEDVELAREVVLFLKDELGFSMEKIAKMVGVSIFPIRQLYHAEVFENYIYLESQTRINAETVWRIILYSNLILSRIDKRFEYIYKKTQKAKKNVDSIG